MIESIPGVHTPEIAILNPEESLAAMTIAVSEAAIRSIDANSISKNPADVPAEFYKGKVFIDYWRAWQPKLDEALRLHNAKNNQSTAVDSFIELQMLLGDTGGQTNVDIFHTDMANAAFLENGAVSGVRDTHQITKDIFYPDPGDREIAFRLFAQKRIGTDIKRSLYVLADNSHVETIHLGNPAEAPGHKIEPGNIHDGAYIFGSNVDVIEDAGLSDWSNWSQGMPWKFIDLTDEFHRAPGDTSNRQILLRISTYSAPARNPERPVSLRLPNTKYYFPLNS